MEDLRQQLIRFFDENSQKLAGEIDKRQDANSLEKPNKKGNSGRGDSIPDAGYHLSFLREAIKMSDDEIFPDYVKWAKLLLREHNISEELMEKILYLTKEILGEYLSSELFSYVSEHIESGIRQLQEPVEELNPYIDPEAPLGNVAKTFNEALLKGDKSQASKIVMDEVKQGTSLKEIYLHVFQKSQLEIGRLWLTNEITVAKEHYASAATQLIMSQLYSYIFATERVGHTFIGACVGGELHELGIRMVGDFFEMEGWDTYYLGANTPVSTIISAAEENHADVIGLSISMPYHRSLVKEAIEQIRRHFNSSHPKILVGGNGINHHKGVWKYLGADGYGSDAQEAVDIANQLIQDK